MEKYMELLIEKVKIMKWEEYLEQYIFNVADMYLILETEGMQDGPANWMVDSENVKGHEKCIAQNSGASVKEGVATMAVLNFKEWYDFRLHVAVHIQQSGTAGVVFRYQDVQNYYMLMIGNGKFEFGK